MVRVLSVVLVSAVALMLPACNQANPDRNRTETQFVDAGWPEEAESEAEPPSRHRFATWQGEWLGPEGMFVIITPVEPGMYQLQMQSGQEMLGTYIGEDNAQGIRFTRNGEQLILRSATGPETGMKWLEQSKSCLMVKQGEGYCRD
jgi:hypothetical protein